MTNAIANFSGSQRPIVFLQGAVPGVTPYCGGSHLWGSSLELLSGRGALCLDLPGSGQADFREQVPTVDLMGEHIARRIQEQGGGPVHLVGHDVGALVALVVAMDHPNLLSSVCLVASAWAAPTGDGVENYTLLHTPQPRWSSESQRWALERLSFSHMHVDDALVAACVLAATQSAHVSAVATMVADGYARTFLTSAARAKFRFFQLARGAGLQVPVQVIAGMHDPMVSIAHMLSLFRIASEKQRRAQFHIVNRCGSFPFREQPKEFMRMVQAFVAGIEQEGAAAGMPISSQQNKHA